MEWIGLTLRSCPDDGEGKRIYQDVIDIQMQGYRRVKDATTTTKMAQQNICESKGDLDGFAIAYFVCKTL